MIAGNCPGFIGNRMINVYGREAQFLLEEGASVEEVNQALFDFGMPMGPLAMYDLVGNDVMRDIADDLRRSRRCPPPAGAPAVVRARPPGPKNRQGWSRYDENRKPSADPEVAALIESTARAAGIERRVISQEEIVDRCILALVNEGARILEEGMALRASDIDVIYSPAMASPPGAADPCSTPKP